MGGRSTSRRTRRRLRERRCLVGDGMVMGEVVDVFDGWMDGCMYV